MSKFIPAVAYQDFRITGFFYKIAALTAGLMSGYFIVGYMAGDLVFWQWAYEQWANGLLAVLFVAAMTGYQFILYQTGDVKGGGKTTVLAVAIAVLFSGLSEIGQSMHREDVRLGQRSIHSPLYQALSNKVASTTITGHPYSDQLAQAKKRMAHCLDLMAQGVYRNCNESQANLDAVNQLISQHYAANQQANLSMAALAKTYERDEENHYALIKFIRDAFDVSAIKASFIFSLVLIIFFEYAFHYLGRRYAFQRQALLDHGYHVGTVPKMPSLQLPVNNAAGVQVTVENGENSGNSTVYAQAQAARVGELVACPQCGEVFQKSNKWHLFCSNNRKPRADGGNCSDDWHNAQKPERAKYAKVKGEVIV